MIGTRVASNFSLMFKRTAFYLLLSTIVGIIVISPFMASLVVSAFFSDYFLVIILSGCGISFILLIIATILIYKFLSPKSKLDKIFLQLGLQRKGFGISSFRYEGQWHSRQVQVCFSQGPLLEIYISTTSQGNIKIYHQANNKLEIQAFDQHWADQIWQLSNIKELTEKILKPIGSSLRQSINLIPQKLVWINYGNKNIIKYDLDYQSIANIFAQLENWLKIVENQSAPEKIKTLSKLEQQYFFNRATLITEVRLFVILGFMLLTIFITALVLGMIYFLDK